MSSAPSDFAVIAQINPEKESPLCENSEFSSLVNQLPHADVLVNLLDVSPARSWAYERHILEKSYQLATTYSPSRADRVSLAILTYNLVVRLKLILETE